MPKIEWEVIDPDDPAHWPKLGPPCGAFNDHTWKLSVFEGRVSLDSGCEECNDVVMSPVGGEDVHMEIQVVGKLVSHLETYGYETPEYDHWWEFVPTQ